MAPPRLSPCIKILTFPEDIFSIINRSFFAFLVTISHSVLIISLLVKTHTHIIFYGGTEIIPPLPPPDNTPFIYFCEFAYGYYLLTPAFTPYLFVLKFRMQWKKHGIPFQSLTPSQYIFNLFNGNNNNCNQPLEGPICHLNHCCHQLAPLGKERYFQYVWDKS